MKQYTRIIPVTGLAAAILLGGSLSAMETTPERTGMRDQTRHSQQSDRNVERSADRSSDRTSTEEAYAHRVAASKVLGMNIDSTSDDKIGEIDEIYIDFDSGEVLAMVVSTGGFLGMGQNQTLISPEDLRFNEDRTLMHADLSKDQIRTAPRYRKGETAGLDQVRPLGKTAAAWDRRSDRTETRSGAGYGQTASDRRATGDERAERTDRNSDVGFRESDRTGTRAAAADRRTTQDRIDRQDRQEGTRAQDRGLAVSDLIGMSVENRQGESVGKINEVYLDLEDREVIGVVVSTGGFLGMGDRKTLFGLREMSIDHRNEKVVLDYNRDQIRGFPEYKANEQSVFTSLRERMDRHAPRASSQDTRTQTDRSLAAQSRDGVRTDSRDDGVRTEARNVGSAALGRSSDKTVFDQGNSSEDIAMTSSIRTAIREDQALSSRANNVTIITKDGKVVLRGEVDSTSEKTTVEGIAQNKAGRRNVTSELTVRGGERGSQ